MIPRQIPAACSRPGPPWGLHALLVALILVPLHGWAAAAPSELVSKINQEIRNSGIPRARISVSVRDTHTGREIVDVASSTPRIPASNMKLLSTGGALDSFPLDHRFRTRLLLDDGRLVIVGDGDPALADPDLLAGMPDLEGRTLDVEGLLELWVRAILDTGASSIKEVIVDDRVFDHDLLHVDWPRNQVRRNYSAEVSGLNFHRNVLALRPRPETGRIVLGESPSAPFLPIQNEMKRGNGKITSNAVNPQRQPLAETITVRGTVVEPQESPIEITIHDPALFTGRLLADRLAKAGVEVGPVRRASDLETFDEQIVVFDVVTPLLTVLRECNHESKNLYAEAILKHLGRQRTGLPGSWTTGSAALVELVQTRTGWDAAGLVVADGSGYSRNNRVPPRLLTRWLATFADDSERSIAFRATLPSPGAGTLNNRFEQHDLHGCDVFAKTGYINGVSGLSGLVIAGDGRSYAFSIIGNDLEKIRTCKRLQESIVEAIAVELGQRASSAMASP